MKTAYLNIGANLGDRHRTLWRAVAALTAVAADGRVRCSATIESEPWGYSSANRYVNIGVAFETDMEPVELLRRLQALECESGATPHRDEAGGYIDRTLDIDIIAIDDVRMETPELTLPHPRARLREFVMTPLAELGYPYEL